MEIDGNNPDELAPRVKLGGLVKKIRIEKGYSIEQAAEIFHTTDESINKFELGEEDATKTDYYQRMFAIRFLKRTKNYNEENMKLINQAYPQDIQEELRKSSKIYNGTGRSSLLKNNSVYFPSEKRSKSGKIKSIILLLVVIILLLLSAYSLYNYSQVRLDAEVKNPTTLVDNTQLEPKTVKEAKVVKKTTKVTKGKFVDNTQEYNINEMPEDTYRLKLEITGDDYIAIFDEKDTGKTLTDAKVYKDGDKIELNIKKNTEKIIMNIGAGKKAKIYINDEELDTSSLPAGQVYVSIINNKK